MKRYRLEKSWFALYPMDMNQGFALFKTSALLLAAGIGLGRLGVAPPQTPRPTAVGRADHVLKVGMPAPDFRIQDLDGRWVELKPFIKKGDMVLLAFFSVSSKEQAETLRNLNGLAGTFGAHSGFRVLAVSSDEPKALRAFARRNKLLFPVLLDADRRVQRAYQIRPASSAYVLIGGNGALFAHPQIL